MPPVVMLKSIELSNFSQKQQATIDSEKPLIQIDDIFDLKTGDSDDTASHESDCADVESTLMQSLPLQGSAALKRFCFAHSNKIKRKSISNYLLFK